MHCSNRRRYRANQINAKTASIEPVVDASADDIGFQMR
jgi:hypothetical protein